MAAVTDFARIAMEEFMERNARLERVKQMMHHATHPTLADHPGAEGSLGSSCYCNGSKKDGECDHSEASRGTRSILPTMRNGTFRRYVLQKRP